MVTPVVIMSGTKWMRSGKRNRICLRRGPLDLHYSHQAAVCCLQAGLRTEKFQIFFSKFVAVAHDIYSHDLWHLNEGNKPTAFLLLVRILSESMLRGIELGNCLVVEAGLSACRAFV